MRPLPTDRGGLRQSPGTGPGPMVAAGMSDLRGGSMHNGHFNMRGAAVFSMAATILFGFTGCKVGPTERGPAPSPDTTLGPKPQLNKPEKQTIPVVQIAEAKGWPPGMKPVGADG